MQAAREIERAQQAWASTKNIPIDSQGRVRDVTSNLLRPLSPNARRAFEKGAGSELAGNMRALHSSSALVANFFDYWTDREMAPLLSAMGICPEGGESLDFEVPYSTGLRGTPPHLDVALTFSSGFVVVIEAKFTEYLGRSTKGKAKFAPSYFSKPDGLWRSKGLYECQLLAEELRAQEILPDRTGFSYLDPWQLLKHALGLAKQLGSGFSLQYIYYDWPGKTTEAHRSEVERFADLVGDELRFKAMTYQRVYEGLRDSGLAEDEYLDYLGERYFQILY